MSKPSSQVNFRVVKGAAEIILYGDIGFEINAREFSDELKALGDVKKMDIRINSFGGDVFDGVTIHTRLVEHPADIAVHIDGIAASAASLIAMAGKTIKIAEAGFVMIHDAWTMMMGNAEEMRKQADRLEAVSAQIANIYSKRTGNALTMIREWMADEREMNAEEALEAGFVTEIFEAERLAAHYDKERHHFKHTPKVLLPTKRAEADRMVTEMRMGRLK